LRTTTRDQFPLEIFVFGESIPDLFGYGRSFLAALCKFICYFLRSLGFRIMFSEATGAHPSFLGTWHTAIGLHNRAMHISGLLSAKVDIESAKVDIRNKMLAFSNTISEKTIGHVCEIFSKCGRNTYFGRSMVEGITGLKHSGASKLIKLMLDSKVIIPVRGHGKGKYQFL
jgi:hypothetical protein